MPDLLVCSATLTMAAQLPAVLRSSGYVAHWNDKSLGSAGIPQSGVVSIDEYTAKSARSKIENRIAVSPGEATCETCLVSNELGNAVFRTLLAHGWQAVQSPFRHVCRLMNVCCLDERLLAFLIDNHLVPWPDGRNENVVRFTDRYADKNMAFLTAKTSFPPMILSFVGCAEGERYYLALAERFSGGSIKAKAASLHEVRKRFRRLGCETVLFASTMKRE